MDLERYLQGLPIGAPSAEDHGRQLRRMVELGLDRLPLPGQGATLRRWRQLAAVGGHDLGLCKLYEGHTDALAIFAELGASPPPGATLGTWAAEPPQARVEVRRHGDGWRLQGSKAWCSGAAVLSHGLLTAWDADGQQQLMCVELQQPGVTLDAEGWHAVGMASSASLVVNLDQAEAQQVGGPGDYLRRPGFWQGGIGIAACWHGAARAIAQRLLEHCATRQEPHALAHLGAVDSALQASASVLRESAQAIDHGPKADAALLARRARAVTETSVECVLQHVGRALGAGPYCQDRRFAQLLADLPVYLRQSHAERDLAALGEQVANQPEGTWQL